MIEKPKKKDRRDWHCLMREDDSPITFARGYNQACDDWEEYLSTRPKIDVGEIYKQIDAFTPEFRDYRDGKIIGERLRWDIAQALAEHFEGKEKQDVK